MATIFDQLDHILPTIKKPGRYTGGELNQIVKDWSACQTKIALVFPDIYDLGMSNLGLAILYDLINQRGDALAERAFSPWVDMEEAIRKSDIPLFSLETKHCLTDFDIIGFSLPYETLYTNVLNVLDLARIPIFSKERNENQPLIIAGGHATFNPEPMHAFIDAFVIGEGEDVIHEIIDAYQLWRKISGTRQILLEKLASIWGVYIPSLYDVTYNPDKTFSHITKIFKDAPIPVLKRIVGKLPPPPQKFIVPYIETVHNRIPIEIMRGCTRGCRFCHAGMVTRSVRERSIDEILAAIETALEYTGFEEIGLLSLSSSDYSHIIELVNQVNERFANQNLSISLPSLRIESLSVGLMDALRNSRRGGFTLAPEAATERMRRIINKPVSMQQLLETTREIYSRGWPTIKLYFMIGHPSEQIEDVQAIVDLCKTILREGKTVLGNRAQVHAGVSTFVPKPHTPFQWVPCDTEEQILSKQALLKKGLREKGIKLTWNDPKLTMLEAWLSRGDRRLSDVIYRAWQQGAKFDAWSEHFNYKAWIDAFRENGLNPYFYTHRTWEINEDLPWDHISTSIRKSFLIEDYHWSLEAKTRQDCREKCFACGVLPKFGNIRAENPGDGWKCPEVKPKSQRKSRLTIPIG
jgi:radical SAM family uncharacterized protein